MAVTSHAQSLVALLKNLNRELFQTETSATLHCRREARRLGDTQPSRVMLAVAEHASLVLEELPGLALRNGLPVSRGGMAAGSMFSALRERFADHLIEAERSYRGTLLGMRHGIDVVRLTREVAEQLDRTELAAFADAWLTIRLPLMTRAEEQLGWFAEHSERAVLPARPIPLLGRIRHA